MPPLIPPPFLCHSRSRCPPCIRPDETTKNHYGATSKDADETTELPSAVAATTGGGRQQVLVRGATATKDINNTAKTAGQGVPKGADKLETTKKTTSAGLVQVREDRVIMCGMFIRLDTKQRRAGSARSRRDLLGTMDRFARDSHAPLGPPTATLYITSEGQFRVRGFNAFVHLEYTLARLDTIRIFPKIVH